MKICPNCCYGNFEKNLECFKCNANLDDAPSVQWNDFKRAGEIQKELKANKEVFGKYVRPINVFPTQDQITESIKPLPRSFDQHESITIKPTKHELKAEAKLELKERIEQMDRDGVAYCPKCFSTSLSANKKGFGIGKAVVGGALIGGIGLAAGNIGAQKVKITCLKCGHQFKPGKK